MSWFALSASFEYLCYDILKILYFFQCGGRLYTSESDMNRRQILMYKDDPRAKKIK